MPTTTVRRSRHRPAAAARTTAGSWWPDAIGASAALTMLVVVALWIHGGGVQRLGGVASALTSAGRLAGLVSADLLLVQVLLMARVPWIERTYGQDRLAHRHRLVGFTSFNLMLAHIVLITAGYAGTGHMDIVAQAWDLVATYPGMLLATAGTAALVLVVVTSIRTARRRLRYESWHLLHLYAYLGVGLSLPHELWTGADFVSSGLAQAYWWTAYGVAAGSVLAFRLGQPAWRSLYHRIVVQRIVSEGPGVVSVYLHGRNLDRLPVRAGQFFLWRFLDGPGWSRGHPYSLSAAPRRDRLRITVKATGDGSARLATLRPGTKVIIEGPYGQLVAARRRSRGVALLACGIGITPLRALLDELPPSQTVLLYRARSEADLIFRAELDEFAARRGVQVWYLLGPRPARRSWLPAGCPPDEQLLGDLVPDIERRDVYLCGPDDWMGLAESAVRRAGVPDERIHLERFAW
ncbi:ferric reductase-like transmembrane domain-containing protein [Dactylosporangium cerinum]|uniref:Ferric reductase-like transmembrane domain-containing protein n=1 Tax=Dactylosporangium cerinum TaxID=1434730 RepID=A0ABV9WHC8_9ACTN